MAQVVVRGIDEDAWAAFKARAKAEGKSAEAAVRELIVEAARAGKKRAEWFDRAERVREQLFEKYGGFPDSDSVEDVRELRRGKW